MDKIQNLVLGSLGGQYIEKLDRPQRVAYALLGVTKVEPIVLMPVTDRKEKLLLKAGRKAKTKGKVTSVKFGGKRVSIVNSGIGTPAMEGKALGAIGAGARVIIRVDVCGGLKSGMDVGELFVAENARAFDGATKSITELTDFAASPLLLEKADEALKGLIRGIRYHKGRIATVDVFFGQTREMLEAWAEDCPAVDMESSMLYHLAEKTGIHAISIMAISDIKLEGVDPFVPGEKRYPATDLLDGMSSAVSLTEKLVELIPEDIPEIR
ncbi:MAG: purine-nucleoside phosphorylase [bacterium]|nr:purine-nucleoside phosphorylase [bacterium]